MWMENPLYMDVCSWEHHRMQGWILNCDIWLPQGKPCISDKFYPSKPPWTSNPSWLNLISPDKSLYFKGRPRRHCRFNFGPTGRHKCGTSSRRYPRLDMCGTWSSWELGSRVTKKNHPQKTGNYLVLDIDFDMINDSISYSIKYVSVVSFYHHLGWHQDRLGKQQQSWPDNGYCHRGVINLEVA